MSSTTVKRTSRTSLRNLISGGGRKGKDVVADALDDGGGDGPKGSTASVRDAQQSKSEGGQAAPSVAATTKSKEKSSLSSNNVTKDEGATKRSHATDASAVEGTTPNRGRAAASGGNVLQRLRERSRSRSRTRKTDTAANTSTAAATKELLVAVTSCRSDGYYSQKAPGSISKLPRKAPTNLKLFHELAVGVKDAYAAVGATPRNPDAADAVATTSSSRDAKLILWDFIGNLDFVRCCARALYHRLSLVARSVLTIHNLLVTAARFSGRSVGRYGDSRRLER